LIGAEPELAVFEDDTGERDQQQDESEQEPAGLRILIRYMSLDCTSVGYVSLRGADRSGLQFQHF
jgi:hypothetical protein